MTTTVLSTTTSFGTAAPEAIAALEKAGFDLVLNPHRRKVTPDELRRLLADHKPAALLAGTETIDRQCLEAGLPELKLISRVGVGWDNIDHDACRSLGVNVVRTEGVLDQAVAELTVGHILAALRHVNRHDADIRGGIWKKRMGVLLCGKTVGIIGFGSIGQRVGKLVSAFDATVQFSDPLVEEPATAKTVTLDQLLETSDIVTIHASGGSTILGPEELLKKCRKGVVVVNMGRGEAIDEPALEKALSSGQVGQACLDVYHSEPYGGGLCQNDNTVLTPHVGSYAIEAREMMEKKAVENLISALSA